MPPLPESARALRAAMGPMVLGKKRRQLLPFRLWTQEPEEEQPWVFRGEFMELEWALDEMGYPPPRPGRVVLVVQGGVKAWLGVGDREGQLREAPRLPGSARERDWVEAWEGDRADARWMLSVSEGVALATRVLVAVDCVEEAVRAAGLESDPVLTRSLEAVRAWTQERCESPAAAQALQASATATPALTWNYAQVRAAWAANGVREAALIAQNVGTGPFEGVGDVLGEVMDLASLSLASSLGTGSSHALSVLAAFVRRRVPLGVVLLGHLR